MSSRIVKLKENEIRLFPVTIIDAVYNADGTKYKYVLPVATASQLGGIKSGSDITIDSSGNVAIVDNSHNHKLSNISDMPTSFPASDVHDWAKASTKPTYTATEVGAISTSEKGVPNGIATLNENGKIPSAQLPSYVDDVLEGTLSTFPATGESAKIYIDTDTGMTYRWTGTGYAVISDTIALGETSSTAYRGDRGKIAYTHSQSTHAPTNAQKNSDITKAEIEAKLIGAITSHTHNTVNGYSILSNVPANAKFTDTTYSAATSSTSGLMSASDKEKLNSITESADSVAYEQEVTSGIKIGTITINGSDTAIYSPSLDTPIIPSDSTLVVSSSETGTSNAQATNNNVHINIVGDNTVKSSNIIKGTGATTVTADSNGNITVNSTNTTYSTATISSNGLLSIADKVKLDSVAQGAQPNSDITKSEIESKLTGAISSHTHDYLPSGGTAVAATKLATARTINGVSFNGTANINIGTLTPIAIPENADLDDYKTAGMYYCPLSTTAATLVNCPSTVEFALLVERCGNISRTQTLTTSYSNHKTYIRSYDSSIPGWASWARVFTTIDPPPTVEGNAETATALTTSAGSPTQPIYFKDGKPENTSHVLEQSVTVDSKLTDTTYDVATTTQDGLLSSEDKTKINTVESGAQKNSSITKAEIESKLTGNISTHTHSNYLPLAGGTLSGSLDTVSNKDYDSNSEYGLDLNDSSIVGINDLYFNSSTHSLNFYRSSNVYDTLSASGGELVWNPNRAKGNIGTNYNVLTTKNFSNNIIGRDGIWRIGNTYHNVVDTTIVDNCTQVLIKTTIPFTHQSDMATINIKGYAYNKSTPIDLSVSFYPYGSSTVAFTYIGAVNNGGWIPTIKLCSYLGSNSTSKLVSLLLEDTSMISNLLCSVSYYTSNTIAYYDDWTITNNASDTSVDLTASDDIANITPVPYRGTLSSYINDKKFDGSSNISLTAEDVGAASAEHTHNNYLPISGGTLTGSLDMPVSNVHTKGLYGIHMHNSDIIGVNALYFNNDASDFNSEGISFYRTATTVDTLRGYNGDLLWTPNRISSDPSSGTSYKVLTTDNYSSFIESTSKAFRIKKTWYSLIHQYLNENSATEIMIKTKIPFKNQSEMTVVHIEGYHYSPGVPLDIKVCFYMYNDAFVKVGATSSYPSGHSITLCTYFDDDVEYVGVVLKTNRYDFTYSTIKVSADLSHGSTTGIHSGWSLSTNTLDPSVTLVTDTRVLSVPFFPVVNAKINGITFDGSTDITLTPASIGASDDTHTHDVATTSTNGFISAADKAKLDGIAAGAQKNSSITKSEIEAKLTGNITSHTHNYLASDGVAVSANKLNNPVKINGVPFDGTSDISIINFASVTLGLDNWVDNTQIVNVTGVTSTNNILISPASVTANDYISNGISCTDQGDGTLTFTALTTPTVAIEVNAMIINV